jgi:epoxide hydrolase-like predicted phosphatase
MIKNVIFDAGRVLVTDVPLKKIAEELSEQSSLSQAEIHSYLYPNQHWTKLTLGRLSEDKYWEHFLEASKVEIDKEALKEKVRNALRPIADNVKLIPLLKDRYRLAILSNHAKEWSQFMREEFDFFRHFQHIIFSCDVGLRKPDPKIYQLILEKLGSQPGECLFVDDKRRNTKGAEEIGMKTITLEDTSALRRELLKAGVKLE